MIGLTAVVRLWSGPSRGKQSSGSSGHGRGFRSGQSEDASRIHVERSHPTTRVVRVSPRWQRARPARAWSGRPSTASWSGRTFPCSCMHGAVALQRSCRPACESGHCSSRRWQSESSAPHAHEAVVEAYPSGQGACAHHADTEWSFDQHVESGQTLPMVRGAILRVSGAHVARSTISCRCVERSDTMNWPCEAVRPVRPAREAVKVITGCGCTGRSQTGQERSARRPITWSDHAWSR